MINSVLAWRWGPKDSNGNQVFGVGALLGSAVCGVVTAFIVLDLLQVTRQVEPPPYLGGDTIVNLNEVCDDFPGTLKDVARGDQLWTDLEWMAFPAPVPMSCEHAHTPALTGTVRWHSCDTVRMVGEVATIPCPANKNGATWAHVVDGIVMSADVYVRQVRSECAVAHEGGHVRGLLATPEEDDKTPYIDGGHTEKPGHLMGESCGDGVKWLNRGTNGDWPY